MSTYFPIMEYSSTKTHISLLCFNVYIHAHQNESDSFQLDDEIGNYKADTLHAEQPEEPSLSYIKN